MGDERFDRCDSEESYYETLRRETQRERGRTREPVRFDVDTVVAQWPCKNPECRQPTDLTTAGADRFEQFNRMLRARGEKPLSTGEVLICPKCVNEKRQAEGARARRKVDRMREYIRALKANPAPTGEVERNLIKQIEIDGHPDVPGLLKAIKERRDAPHGKRRPGKDDL